MSALFPALWRKQQGNYFFLATKNEEGEFRSHCFARKDFNKVREFIKNHPKHDVYACPHGFRDKFRRKSSAVPPNYLYADLDEVHPNSCELVPTIALESSPGLFVGYWLVDEPITWELNQR